MGGINKIQHLDRVPALAKGMGQVAVMLSFGVGAYHGFTAPNALQQIRADKSPALACAGCAEYPDMLVERRIVRQDYQGTSLGSKNGSLGPFGRDAFKKGLTFGRVHPSRRSIGSFFAARKVARIHIAGKPLAKPKTNAAYNGSGK